MHSELLVIDRRANECIHKRLRSIRLCGGIGITIFTRLGLVIASFSTVVVEECLKP